MQPNYTAIDLSTLNVLTVCSFRYALGRRTYIVNDIASFIISNIKQMQNRTLKLIVREIVQAIDRDGVGDDCDKRDWQNVLQAAIAEIDRRTENGEDNEL